MNKTFTGEVISDKMNKTVTVLIERKFRHRFYNKIIIRHRKFKAHNEEFKLKIGDLVKIQETKPISKEKHFIVIEKMNK